MWHYRRLAERQLERLRNPDGSLRIKRYFYCIRPVLAIRWLRLHPGAATPPMDMGGLMDQCELASDLKQVILELIEQKKFMTEKELIRSAPALTDALIGEELAWADTELGASREAPYTSTLAEADTILAAWTRKCDPSRQGELS